MKTLTLFAFLMILPATVLPDKLIIGGVSHHFMPFEYDANEIHPAIGYEWGVFEASIYKNTFNRTSVALAYIDRPWRWKGISAGYRFGVASGYKNKEFCKNEALPIMGEVCVPKEVEAGYKGFMPQAQLVVSTNYKRAFFDLGISPVSTIVFKLNL